jgi:hypothetical protein
MGRRERRKEIWGNQIVVTKGHKPSRTTRESAPFQEIKISPRNSLSIVSMKRALLSSFTNVASRPAFTQARHFAVGIGAGNPSTPGWVPSVGNKIAPSVTLQKARKWDDGVADGFKAATYDELFKGKKVNIFFFTICESCFC